MNIIQIGCGDGGDSVFSFVVDHEKNIENCILIDANPEVLKKATAKYSKFPFCELRNLAVLPIETEGYKIKLFSSITDPCFQAASVKKEHVAAHLREEPSLEFKVPTISLTSLLKEYIETDYLFIDTEGLDALNLLSVNFNRTILKQIVFERMHTDGVLYSGPRLRCLIKYLQEFKFVITPDPQCPYNLMAKR